MSNDKFSNYRYFHGEDESPYKDFGRYMWWGIESNSFKSGDTKFKDSFTLTMVNYILYRHWENESMIPTTTKDECIKRAYELYYKGLWSSAYLCDKNYTMNDVIKSQ